MFGPHLNLASARVRAGRAFWILSQSEGKQETEPLSYIPAIVMQKASQGPNWTEKAHNADDAEIFQHPYFLCFAI